MNEERKPFTVSDRRHFSADGVVRADPVSEGSPPPAPVDAEEAGEWSAEAGGPADFAGFLLSLGAQAGALLAEVGEEKEGRDRALAVVRSTISILEMLHEKTEGRRTPEEDRVLASLLYQLRMGYVAAARAASA